MTPAEHAIHDPSWDFEDDELSQLAVIANQNMEYWLELARTGEEPMDDFGMRAKIDAIANRSEFDLARSSDMIGSFTPKSWKPLKKIPPSGFVEPW